MIRVANAPVSYGTFELTVGKTTNVPGPEEVLAAIAGAGYAGTELGPPGFLGERETLRERLDRFGLELPGGYVPLRLTDPEHRAEDEATLLRTLDLLEAGGGRAARPVLADAGTGGRPRLDDDGWRRLAESVARAAELARARGFEPTFHHHAGTFVETPAEVERLLELTDVGLLLDTGHLAVGGGDPVQALRAWRHRIDYVHLKDVRLDVLRDSADLADAWRRGFFCELSAGDVDLQGFLAELQAGGYSGWIVVEQDWVAGPDADPATPVEAQARNRRWLAERAGL
jgi:inosose dehydratase